MKLQQLIHVFLLFATLVITAGCQQDQSQPAATTQGEDNPWFAGHTVYEVYPRAYSTSGKLTAITEDLDSLAAYGIKTIWLMPIHPVGIEGRKGTAGSPYSVRDYFAVADEYGTLEDLRQLVAGAHEREMRVIMDMVMNHSANDYPLMNENPDLWMRDSTGAFVREVEDWSDITDWNFENDETRDYLKSVLMYWIQEAEIDGYRCDVAGIVPADFWESSIINLKSVKPDIFMLAEWEEPWVLEAGFDAAYDWNLYHRMRDHLRGDIDLDSLWRAVELKHDVFPFGKYPLRFLENHDEPRAADVFGWPGLKPYAALIYTIPGIPLLYNGQEIAAEHRPSLFEPDPINWNETDSAAKQFYRGLVQMRNKLVPLLYGTTVHFPVSEQNSLMFERAYGDERVFVAINFSDKSLLLDRPASLGAGEWQKYGGYDQLGEKIEIKPFGHNVYVLQY